MIVKLQGGLGNQLFQAAYGFSESWRRSLQLYFDKSAFATDPLRNYALDAYDLPIKFKDDHAAETGYWQAEKYFDKELVRGLFRKPKGSPNQKCWEMAHEIYRSPESCFIGVRRADYLWPERIHFHGVMPWDYYCTALMKLPDKQVFVFTDDIPWCRVHFRNCEFVDVNGENEKHWDIWLMSLCKHAIIANSTFHWWGAWLGADKCGGKIVAPKKWFANGMKTDIVPERWITL